MSDIIQEIRSGNKDAVKAVYQEYSKDVYNFAKSITGDHDRALAATKKTFLTLFKNIQNGDEPANLRTAALKLAYDEAYKMAAPKEEPAIMRTQSIPAEEVEEAVEEPAGPAEPAFVEPYQQRRAERRAAQAAQVEEEYDEYEETYEEEDDDFVPPQREKDADRDEVYIPKGGYDTLRIDPVAIEEEQEEMRAKRRSGGRRRRPQEEVEEAPRSRKAKDVDVYALKESDDDFEESYDEDYDDDDYEEKKKPRNKGLFIYCIILNIILILILLWFLGGLLVNLGILPDIDLGYSWFNAHIYPLF